MKTTKQMLENLVVNLAQEAGARAAWASQAQARMKVTFSEISFAMHISDLSAAQSIMRNLRQVLTPADFRVALNNARFRCRETLNRGGVS